MNMKTIFLMILQIAMISAYMPNHQYNMLEKRKLTKEPNLDDFHLRWL